MEILTGKQRKEEALDLFEGRQDAWLANARDMAAQLARENGKVTSDDIWLTLPPPLSAHPSVMGALFRDNRFRLVDFTLSKRPRANARRIGVYELTS